MPNYLDLKCFFQQGNNTYSIDSTCIEKLCRIDSHLVSIDKQIIHRLLERNQIINKDYIDSIRYFHPQYKGWVLIREDTTIDLKGSNPSIKLLIKRSYQNDELDPNEQAKNSIAQRIKKIKSILEIKSMDDNINNLSLTSMTCDLNIKSELDISILYSNPLYNKDANYFYNSIYDYHSNISCLYQTLGLSPLAISIDFSIATIESFESCVKKYPKIITIVCASGYDDDGSFFLLFEKSNGEVEKLTEGKLSLIFSECEDYKQNVIIIILTSFAEDAMQIFKDQHFENIISIHSTSSNTSTSNKFISLFYENIFNNKLLQEAFENAKTIVAQLELTESKNCCCFHNHKDNCKWKLFSIANPEEAHFIHMKNNCKCKKEQFNLHLFSCPWSKGFLYKTTYSNVCCCQSTLTHNISSTILGHFANSFNHEGADEGVFPNSKNGPCIITGKTFASLNNDAYPMIRLVGKCSELYQVVKLLMEKNMRLIILYSQEKNGKTSFALILYRYLYEKIKKTIYIDYIEIIDTNGLEQLERNLIGDNERIIILNSLKMQQGKEDSLKSMIKKIYLRNQHTRIVIISRLPIEIEYENQCIELKPLKELASRIFLINEKSLLHSSQFDKTIKKSQGIPAMLLLYSSQSKSSQRIKRSGIQMHSLNSNKIHETVYSIFENFFQIALKNNFPELPLLFYYCPYGLLNIDLHFIYKSSLAQVLTLIKEEGKNLFFKNIYDNTLEGFKAYLVKININNCSYITIEVKQKCIEMLFEFFSKLWRILVNSVYANENFIEFSAAQNYGLWLSLDERTGIIRDNNKEKIDLPMPISYHYLAYENFINFFTDDNINIVYENKEVWPRVKKYIEELTICLPSFMKIVKNSKAGVVSFERHIEDYYQTVVFFENRFEKYENEFTLASARLTLFKNLFLIFENEYSIESVNAIESNIALFKKENCLLGVIESLFSLAVVAYKINHNTKKSGINMQEAKKIAQEALNDTISNNINKEALQITLGRIIYQSSLYHVNDRILLPSDLNDLDKAEMYFKATSRVFYEIKTMHLKAQWYRLSVPTALSKQIANDYLANSKLNLEQAKHLAMSINQSSLNDEIHREMQLIAQPNNSLTHYHQLIPYINESQRSFVNKIKELLEKCNNRITLEYWNVIIAQEKMFAISLGKNVLLFSGDIVQLGNKKIDEREMLTLVYEISNKKSVDLIILHMPMRDVLQNMMLNFCRSVVVINDYDIDNKGHMEMCELFIIELLRNLIDSLPIPKAYKLSEMNWKGEINASIIMNGEDLIVGFFEENKGENIMLKGE